MGLFNWDLVLEYDTCSAFGYTLSPLCTVPLQGPLNNRLSTDFTTAVVLAQVNNHGSRRQGVLHSMEIQYGFWRKRYESESRTLVEGAGTCPACDSPRADVGVPTHELYFALPAPTHGLKEHITTMQVHWHVRRLCWCSPIVGCTMIGMQRVSTPVAATSKIVGVPCRVFKLKLSTNIHTKT